MKYLTLLLLLTACGSSADRVKNDLDSLTKRKESLSSLMIRQSDSLDQRKEAVEGSPISDSLYSEILLRITATERQINTVNRQIKELKEQPK